MLRCAVAGLALGLVFALVRAPVGAADDTSALPSSLTASRSAVFAGEQVNFSYSSSLPAYAQSESITSAIVDFGDGDSTYLGSAGPAQDVLGSASHVYLAPGTYVATLRTIASDGELGTDEQTISVVDRSAAAQVQLQAPPSGQAGSPLTMGYSLTPEGGPDATLQLSYGDGSIDQLPFASGEASHSYAAAGTYIAVLTELDSGGGVLRAASAVIQVARGG
jgi:PKD domain-containing protein